ncbi:YjcZ family sporulation protein [Sporolactobacillus spathodeae]
MFILIVVMFILLVIVGIFYF